MTMASHRGDAAATTPLDSNADWSYETAFSRNRGLINPQEHEKRRTSISAVAWKR